jgi:hypothetical protein
LSRREAIIEANANGEDDTIQLAAGTYRLSIANTDGQENEAAQGDLDLTEVDQKITIEGAGRTATLIDADMIDRVFHVLGNVDVELRDLTVRSGLAQDDGTEGDEPGDSVARGGGILNAGGRITLGNVKVAHNEARGGVGGPGERDDARGGGIWMGNGALNLRFSALIRNMATGGNGGDNAGSAYGGAICAEVGGDNEISINRSSIRGNRATGGHAADSPYYSGGQAYGGASMRTP